MKKIVVVQSIPYVLDLIKDGIKTAFPRLGEMVSYQSDFEQTLISFPKEGEVVVIASDSYYDEKNELFSAREKDGSRLAEEIKKINPQAKVYIFSTYRPRPDYVDGFYQKASGGGNTLVEIVKIFLDLNLNA